MATVARNGLAEGKASEWRAFFAARPGAWLRLALLLAPLAVMYYPAFLLLLDHWWRDPNNSHGVLMPPLAAYFVWRRREGLLRAAAEPRFLAGLLAVLCALAVYFVGIMASEVFLTRMSLLALLVGMTLYFRGWEYLKILAFPLLLLALSVPIPALIFNSVSLPLQSLASQWSAAVLQACGIPVLREGNVINLASASLGVAEACSGIRSLVSLVALSVILGYLRWSGWVQRLLLVALSVPLALFLNMVRIAGTGLIADYWNVKYAMGFFHTFSGWIVFVLAFIILFGTSALIQRLLPSPAPQEI